MLAMANDVWDWCENTGARGRTVTVKVKWADFRLTTRSRSLALPVLQQGDTPRLQPGADLLGYPPRAGIRLVGVTLSNFQGDEREKDGQLPLDMLPLCETSPTTGRASGIGNRPRITISRADRTSIASCNHIAAAVLNALGETYVRIVEVQFQGLRQ